MDAIGNSLTHSAVGNEYFFTGRRFEAEINLYYYRARFYSSELGRFLQPDPIGYSGGINIYAYCGNNSVNFVDPWGWCPEGDGGGFWDWAQGGLDFIGCFDPTPISDGANALISAARGNWGDAGINALAMVPFVGDLGKAGKYVDKANDARKFAKKGNIFRGGKKKFRDYWGKHSKNKDFQRWWHRKGKKEWGGRDFEPEELDDVFNDWVSQGKPKVK